MSEDNPRRHTQTGLVRRTLIILLTLALSLTALVVDSASNASSAAPADPVARDFATGDVVTLESQLRPGFFMSARGKDNNVVLARTSTKYSQWQVQIGEAGLQLQNVATKGFLHAHGRKVTGNVDAHAAKGTSVAWQLSSSDDRAISLRNVRTKGYLSAQEQSANVRLTQSRAKGAAWLLSVVPSNNNGGGGGGPATPAVTISNITFPNASADQAPGPGIAAGNSTLKFSVQNTSGSPITELVTQPYAHLCAGLALDVGETVDCQSGITLAADTATGTGFITVSAKKGAQTVGRSAPYYYTLIDLGLVITSVTIDGAAAGEAPGPTVTVPAIVELVFEVENTGAMPLSLTWTYPVVEGCIASTLAAGETTTCTKSISLGNPDGLQGYGVTGQYEDLVTGAFAWVRYTPTTDVAPNPAISLTALAINGAPAQVAPGPVTQAGDRFVTFVATNTGDVVLTNITSTPADACPSTTLATGETMTCSATVTFVAGGPGSLAVELNATGAGTTVGADDTAYYDMVTLVMSNITLDGQAADTEPGPQFADGTDVLLSFEVSNTSNINVPSLFTWPYGFTCSGTSLAAGASKTCSKTITVHSLGPASTPMTVSSAFGGYVLGLYSYTTAPSSDPAISLSNVTVNGLAAEFAPGPLLLVDSATLTFDATNSGDVTLNDITSTPANACPSATLEPGEAMTCTASIATVGPAGPVQLELSATSIDAGSVSALQYYYFTTGQPWLGTTPTTVDLVGSFSGDLSGLDYQSVGAGSDVLWASRNNGEMYRYVQSGGTWALDADWGSRILEFSNGQSGVDAEGVVYVEEVDSLYVASERRNGGNQMPNRVLAYDAAMPATAGDDLVPTGEWHIGDVIGTTSQNRGIEAITWIPDSFLVANGLMIDGTPFSADTIDTSGVFLIGIENPVVVDGTLTNLVMVALRGDGSADGDVQLVAVIDTIKDHVMGLDFDADAIDPLTGGIWTVCHAATGCEVGTMEQLQINSAGQFESTALVDLPTTIQDYDNEGLALQSRSSCDGVGESMDRSVFWADDADGAGYSLRTSTWSLGC